MSMPERSPIDLLRTGQAALARGAWGEARAFFAAALRGEETPEALEGLGMAGWGLNDTATTFAAREQAYRLYRQRGDQHGAARMATHLAINHFYFRGEYAIASGWLQRARRLVAGLGPCPELGWLAVTEAQIVAWAEHDFARVRSLCAEATTLGNAFGDMNLQMLALACEGFALVGQGMIGEGMRRLDEATLAAVAGEMTDIDATCTACCCLIFACEWVRDYERVAQWINRLKALAARWSHPTLFSFCRIHHAGLLIALGTWADAEAELEAAIVELETTQPALAAEALVRLADLRCRQGRLDAAAALVARAEAPPFRALVGHFCLLGRAAIAFAQNDLEAAIDLAHGFLRAVPKQARMERVAGLELLVLLLALRGDTAQAEAGLGELQAVATLVATGPMQASARFAAGVLAAAMASYDTAKDCFEDAIELWARSGAPYEMALARLELATSLLALGRKEAAEQQAQEAFDVLQRLGALPDATRAMGLLREIATTAQRQADPSPAAADLTPREREVLRLVAAGQSNQQIARELVLSVRTVERHISNIYAKIGAGGPAARAAATAYALHQGLTTPPST
jgi:LuxR family transcriptional regulator, maltose regulon positive regulatory protein